VSGKRGVVYDKMAEILHHVKDQEEMCIPQVLLQDVVLLFLEHVMSVHRPTRVLPVSQAHSRGHVRSEASQMQTVTYEDVADDLALRMGYVVQLDGPVLSGMLYEEMVL
jgi:hypothetical protein